jgi:ATP-binding cassette, subfamily B, bacterial
MNLLYELPLGVKELMNQHIKDNSIIYCTPFDLKSSGEQTEGWFVITEDEYLIVEMGVLQGREKIANLKNYRMLGAVGNGSLEAEGENEDRCIIRFSMAHVARYTYIARILNAISRGERPKVVSDEKENQCPKCGRPYLRGLRTCHYCVSKKAVFKKFVTVTKPYMKLLLISIVLFWIITGLSLVNPQIFRILIDKYISNKNGDGRGIFILIMALGLSNLIRTIIEVIKNRLMIKVGTGISKDLRNVVFAKLQSLSISYLDSRKIGDLMNRVTGDTNSIKNFISNQASFAVNQFLTFIVVIVILLLLNWKLTLLVMAPAPFIVWFWRWMRTKLQSMFHTQRKTSDKCNSILHDILSGIKVVKAFGMEEKEVKNFSGASLKLAYITERNEKMFNTVYPLLNFFMGVGQFLILYYGGKLILKSSMELGELIQFTQYTNMLYGPLGWITFFPRALTEASIAAERLFEILDEEPAIKEQVYDENQRITGNVTIKDVTFGYKTYEPVLDKINLDVEPGEMIGLVGASGAGKSTLINLIMRLYDADEGSILIDGRDIKEYTFEDLHSQIGVVLQETFLFSGTILQNITYAKPNTSLESVIKAAKIANAHDFIMKLPDGYDTRVGEKGQRLSGGEKQRIAIARAILHDPKILILDEATASVDTETEYQIQEALGRLVKNRTTFAIAHRLSTLRNATRLMVIDKGKRIELGTHEQLIKARGKYYSLVMAQREMSRTKEG